MCNQFSFFYFQQAAPCCQPSADEQTELARLQQLLLQTERLSREAEAWLVMKIELFHHLWSVEVSPKGRGVGRKVSTSGNLRLLPFQVVTFSWRFFSFFFFTKRKTTGMHLYSLNHRRMEVAQEYRKSSCPSTLHKQDNLELVAQDHFQMAFGHLQGWRLHSLPGQTCANAQSPSKLKGVSCCSGGPSFYFNLCPLLWPCH